MASNIQRGPRRMDASDWTRIKKLNGARGNMMYATGPNSPPSNNTYKDVVNPEPRTEVTTGRRVYTEVGGSKIRRPASNYTDYIASQNADYVLESINQTNLVGKDLLHNWVCGCSDSASTSAGALQFTSDVQPSFLRVAKKDSLFPGTGTFTISFYLKMTSPYDGGPQYPRVFALSSDSEGQLLAISIEGTQFYLWIMDSNIVEFDYSAVSINGVDTNCFNNWHFISIARSETGNIFISIDGFLVETGVSEDDITSTDDTAALNIGSYPQDEFPDGVSMTGYLANFRWVVGEFILYELGNFPSPPLPVIPGKTSLLLLANTEATYLVDSGTDSVNTDITLVGPTPPVWSSQAVVPP